MTENDIKLRAKILSWIANGETGLSSKAMAFCACDIPFEGNHNPADPADFNRCLKLISAIPEVKENFHKIAKLSKRWKNLIENWDDLESIFIDEVGFDWCKANSAPVTYERMQLLRA
jgi:hypothetical protein